MTAARPIEGRALADRQAPGLANALEGKYGALLPGVGQTLSDWLFVDHYARPGLDLKTRKIVSVAVLAALGGHTAPQLRLNIDEALNSGATERELAEAIWQIGIYAGMPASIAGLNTLNAVLEERLGPENQDAARSRTQA